MLECYRDHVKIGARIARWFGIDQGWTLFEGMFSEFEHAPRFLPSAPLTGQTEDASAC